MTKKKLTMGTRININWTLADIVLRAKDEFSLELSLEQAKEIADMIEAGHDAELGVNWNTIDFSIIDWKEKQN